MKPNENRKSIERANHWERSAARSSADVLAILAPTDREPKAIRRTGIWKTGPATQPAGSAA